MVIVRVASIVVAVAITAAWLLAGLAAAGEQRRPASYLIPGEGVIPEGIGVVWDRRPDGTFAQDIRAVRLSRDLASGTLVARVADPRLRDPTTLARDRDRLLVVNSQLQRQPGTPPFTVSAIPDPLR